MTRGYAKIILQGCVGQKILFAFVGINKSNHCELRQVGARNLTQSDSSLEISRIKYGFTLNGFTVNGTRLRGVYPELSEGLAMAIRNNHKQLIPS